MTDLLEWAAGFTVPRSSEGTPGKVRFRAATLPPPTEPRTDRVRVRPSWRRPNGEAILIDVADITAEREGYRALGLALLSYALSEQKEPLRIHLPAAPESEVRQIVLWPDTPSPFELDLGIQLRVTEARYRPRARKLDEHDADGSPIPEPDDEETYPREHLPYCSLGPPTSVRGGPPMLPGEPWCLHLAGTGPSLVWLGKLLLDLSLSDSNRGHTCRYNALPAEELAHGSAELSLTVQEPAEPSDAEDASWSGTPDRGSEDGGARPPLLQRAASFTGSPAPMNLPTEPYLAQVQRWPREGRHVLAQFDDDTVVVYQAYRPAIGHYAARYQRFGGEFSLRRMSWVKPNFLWMMYRSGWGTREGQEVTLAVRIRRAGFDSLLREAVHSSFDERVYASHAAWEEAVARSSVRLQWDPDHDPAGGKLARRAIQIGLRGDVLARYASEWIVEIQDVSAFVAEQREHAREAGHAALVTPREDVYPIADPETAARLGIDPPAA